MLLFFHDDTKIFNDLLTIYLSFSWLSTYFIYFLVVCQITVKVTPTNGQVEGSFGGSVKLQWNILKGNDTDRLALADLFAVFGTSSKLLFTINTETQQPETLESVKGLFGDRLSAVISDGKMYKVTLENLNYNDSISFMLEIQLRNDRLISLIETGEIKLTVKGMEYLIICFLVPTEVRKIK